MSVKSLYKNLSDVFIFHIILAVGSFEYQFNEPGTYYFTTGIFGANQDLEMRGKINVTEKVPIAANVTVRVGGQEAQHNAGSGNHQNTTALETRV